MSLRFLGFLGEESALIIALARVIGVWLNKDGFSLESIRRQMMTLLTCMHANEDVYQTDFSLLHASVSNDLFSEMLKDFLGTYYCLPS